MIDVTAFSMWARSAADCSSLSFASPMNRLKKLSM